jgi:hypothetical protein
MDGHAKIQDASYIQLAENMMMMMDAVLHYNITTGHNMRFVHMTKADGMVIPPERQCIHRITT